MTDVWVKLDQFTYTMNGHWAVESYYRFDGTIGETVNLVSTDELRRSYLDVPEAGISHLLMMYSFPVVADISLGPLEASVLFYDTFLSSPADDFREEYVDVRLGASVVDWQFSQPTEPLRGSTVTLSATDVNGIEQTGRYYDYFWIKIEVEEEADPSLSLFSINADQVNFNALTNQQRAAIAASRTYHIVTPYRSVTSEVVSNPIYHAANGDDLVVLPNDAAKAAAARFDAGAWFYGGDGNDTIRGGALDDRISGDVGTDHLSGGAGNDVLDGGYGADTMEGGAGNDTFLVQNVGDVVIERAGEGIDLVNSSVSFTLSANVENLTLIGTDQGVNATGNALKNVLVGTAVDNILDGRGGADIMTGGRGSDIYIVDDIRDKVVEAADGDIYDLVKSSASFSLPDNVEYLILTGTGNIDGTGNNAQNRMAGNAGNNVLDGRGGADIMQGGQGNDTYVFDVGNDQAWENPNEGIDLVKTSISLVLPENIENVTLIGNGNINATGDSRANILIGNAGSNILDGQGGDNVLNGGSGADTMMGGAGNDIYYVDNSGDVVTEGYGGGIDLVFSSVSFSLGGQYIERLTLTGSGNINGSGNSLDNILTGNSGNNYLSGGAGADTMAGGAGDDTYKVDDAGDIVVEKSGQGSDQVNSSVSFSLGGQYIERLTLTSNGNINGLGNSLDNILTGNSGNNYLSGGAGADTMAGGAGNDTYKVDDAGDIVVEKSGQGSDQVNSSVSFSLGGQYIERLTLTGSGNINGLGNSLDNTLIGNAGDNVLNGSSGADTMTGGAGSDIFAFSADLVAGTIDTITDFSVAADRIRLSHTIFSGIVGTGTLSAAQFVANAGGTAQDANDRIIYETDTGKLFYDSDGSAAGGATQFATIAPGLALTNANFSVS